MRAKLINESDVSRNFTVKKGKFEPFSAPWYDIRPLSKQMKEVFQSQSKLIKERQPNIATLRFKVIGELLDGSDVLASLNFGINESFYRSILFKPIIERGDIADYYSKESEFPKEFGYTLRSYFRRKFAREVPFTYEINYGGFQREIPDLIEEPHIMDMDNEFDFNNFVNHGAGPLVGQGHFTAQQEELVTTLKALYDMCPDTLTYKVTDGKISKTYHSEEEDFIFNTRKTLKSR